MAANGGGARAESKVVPTVADMVAQTDLTLYPSIAMVPRRFAGHSRRAKRIGEELRPVAQCAYDETNKPSSNMFGEAAPAKRSDGLGKLDERSSAKNLEVPGGQQPVRGDL